MCIQGQHDTCILMCVQQWSHSHSIGSFNGVPLLQISHEELTSFISANAEYNEHWNQNVLLANYGLT